MAAYIELFHSIEFDGKFARCDTLGLNYRHASPLLQCYLEFQYNIVDLHKIEVKQIPSSFRLFSALFSQQFLDILIIDILE